MIEVPTTRYAKTTDGVHIAYQVWGEGPRDILVSTALWWNLEFQWTEPSVARFWNRLGRLGRVIMFDKRGTGLSDRVPDDHLPTLEERSDDIRVVLDAVGSERSVVYGGFHGAPLAIVFAATQPERTQSLILVDSQARVVRTTDHPWGLTPELAERTTELMEQRWGGSYMLRFSNPSRADEPETREWWATMQRMSASPAAAMTLWRMAMATDVSEVLPIIRVPTLVVHHSDNRLMEVGCGRYVASHIPGARFVEVPGGDLVLTGADDILDLIEEFVTGRHPVSEPDRVLATVLFTDIVDSTRRAVEMGDRQWRETLDRHDALVERALERYRGRKVNSTGDGMLAVFDGPARAVHCATAIRDGAGALGFEVRAGLHTGEVELRGDDIGGVAVHIGARVAALAQTDQVLVSRTVTDLVAGSGITFTDRGEHELKGVPGSWRLFAVEG